MTTPNPFIRPYAPTDFSKGLHIFFTTLEPTLDFEPARTIGSYLWYKAYVLLTPSTCFILDDGTGRAVGYIIGTPDTTTFSQRWVSTFTPIVDPILVPPPNVASQDAAMEREDVRGFRKAVYAGECSMLQSSTPPIPDLLKQYPAHLHIDILPEYQGQGWGAKMMDIFLDCVKKAGARGVHLGMVRWNAGAKRFYERLGFQVVGEVLDGGVSGEVGVHGDAICLVKEL
ncbi:GCN5-related N-acetyltransferas-like protein [Lentithecium fluviatile CBS 122367]|uniref:GCN5-related N-acetyltransferas-like protein n=1 Tax=Lentithecium fluviatile CBS 122367 TaxID=1168545 RepID=A0A6G1JBM9_9PLEO|nr:GCN5-related N-acetyltransferas-like protein [Lentithecium fluviatile CBS 122367]